MDVRKLEYFIHCAECLNITHAAARIHISQQALSKHIKQLEIELGENLFERSNSSLKLTEVGKKVYDTFNPLIRNLHYGYEEVKEFIKYKQNTVRFAYFSDIPYSEIIAPLIRRMQDLSPDVRVNMIATDIGLDREFLMQDSVDFVVSVKAEDSLWNDVNYSVIKTMDSKIIVSEAHPWYTKDKVTVDDIAKESFIVYDDPSAGGAEYYLDFIKAKDRIPVPNVDTFMGVLSQGRGFGVMSETYSRKNERYRLLDLPECYAHTVDIIVAYKKLHPLRNVFEKLKEIDV